MEAVKMLGQQIFEKRNSVKQLRVGSESFGSDGGNGKEERCQIVACRKGQDVSTGKKFILKYGEVVRIGRGNDNEVILDYEGVSKHHAEIFMRAKQPEEVILGADLKMTGLLSIRDLNSRNGLSIHKSPLAAVPPLGAFDRIVPGIVQAVQDGWSVLVPAKSRHQDKQMTVEQRLLTLYVSSVMVESALCSNGLPEAAQAASERAAGQNLAACSMGVAVSAEHAGGGHGHSGGRVHYGHGGSVVHHDSHMVHHGHAGHGHAGHAGHVVHEDDGCENVGSICFEPVGKKTVATWKWVGDGRGSYEKVENFAYVGENAGSFERRLDVTYSRWKARGCVLGLLCCLLLGLALFLVLGHFFHRQYHDEPEPHQDDVWDCTKDFFNWQTLWTVPHQEWCCVHYGRGCPTTTPATTSPAFDCDAAFNNWRVAWSSQKKAWCCHKLGRGCPPHITTPYNCHTGDVEVWTVGKRLWCCQNYEVSCPDYHPSLPYDCHAGLENWVAGWSVGKKGWCCAHYKLGCAPVTHPPTVVHGQYDCHAGYSNWRLGWSAHKKLWCCHRFHRGCSDAPYDCDAGYSNWQSGWSTSKKAWCCHHTHRGCIVSLPYDCDAGYSNWKLGWSASKKSWCCAHSHRGCGGPTYDCNAGYSHWMSVWTPAKKEWCCHHYHHGCPPASVPYDCDAGFTNWRAGWSDGKKKWCCHHANRGCSHMPYDCDAGYSNWHHGWSDEKKKWCCHHFHRGCEISSYDCDAGYDDWKSVWSNNKKYWCCEHFQKGCSHWDCDKDYSDWVHEWGAEKKQYCCNKYHRGCSSDSSSLVSAGYDMHHGVVTSSDLTLGHAAPPLSMVPYGYHWVHVLHHGEMRWVAVPDKHHISNIGHPPGAPLAGHAWQWREHKHHGDHGHWYQVPVPPPVQEPPPVLAPPRQLPQVTPALFTPPPADAEIAKALKPKKKKKPKEDERPAARPKSRPEGLATISGEAWPPPLPREESDASDGGQDIPPPKAKSGPGPGQRPLTSPRPERRRSDKVEVSSDEEGPAPRLTQANVAKVSAAAAVAVGVSEPDDVDPDLRSISPISTPGVFPWQVGKKAKKKPRAESPCSAEAQVRKKRKGETGKATKAKKLLLTAPGQGMQWDPYMPRATEPSPSPCSAIPGKASRGKSSKDVRDRFDPSLGKDAKRAGEKKKRTKEKEGGGLRKEKNGL
ncbi:hypothetical protein AK812_SmicGene13411 [Symbiodinium microadriaticum]|uniref:FHA domain-containing protein n=1 Tax=Symbiodinium microadriaticum TaxID=2951 RepID=A0A1Q9E887_SYMMI|nr:hypothetical protein AK812_SmicGene13411 [Symbiodinium microadriaticum]